MDHQPRPGFRWCEDCLDYIPDAIPDHFDRHEQQEQRAQRSTPPFLIGSALIGALAAIIIHLIFPTL